MKTISRIALTCAAVTLLAIAPARADDNSVAVLSPNDVSLYQEIFAAQSSGQIAEALTLTGQLTDTSLLGYIEQQRLLLPRGHTSTFSELKNWMERYGDYYGAERVYKLAMAKRPRKSGNAPRPLAVRWRGASYDQEGLPDASYGSSRATKLGKQLRAFARAGAPDASAALMRKQKSGSLSSSDRNKLNAYVAATFLASNRYSDALVVAETVSAGGGSMTTNSEWIAGLAAFGLGQFDRAAQHFEAYSRTSNLSAQDYAAVNFWAARAYARAEHPENSSALLDRAASERATFYGALAARQTGRDIGDALVDAAINPDNFSSLMQIGAMHRAVASWQVGRRDIAEAELSRAFAQMPPELDVTFAAVARVLGFPTLELRAAEDAAFNGVYLTSLYPVPPYRPREGYSLDPALILAFARQESRFDTDAVSRSGARGVMQLMPPTAALVTGDRSLSGRGKSRLDDPEFNMQLGQAYLLRLLGDEGPSLFALAVAYNSGPGNLHRWMNAQGSSGDSLLFVESIPNAETRAYVKRVMMNLWMYRKRLNEPADGLDETAAGQWPQYNTVHATQTASGPETVTQPN